MTDNLSKLALPKFFLLILLFASFGSAVAQAEYVAEQSDSSVHSSSATASKDEPESFKDSADRFVQQLVSDAARFRQKLTSELSQIEGDFLVRQLSSISKRFREIPSSRALWTLIAIFTCIVLVLVLLIVVSIFVANPQRPGMSRLDKNRAKRKVKKDVPQIKEENKNLIPSEPATVSDSAAENLKNGFLEEVESSLWEAIQENPEDYGSIMYLFCCFAARQDDIRFGEFVDKIFCDTSIEQHEVGAHIAQVGRLLSIQRFSDLQIGEPPSPFTNWSELMGNTLKEFHDFGDLNVCLDMLRAYFEMEEKAKSRHLIVELLVHGDLSQRESALQFAEKINA